MGFLNNLQRKKDRNHNDWIPGSAQSWVPGDRDVVGESEDGSKLTAARDSIIVAGKIHCP